MQNKLDKRMLFGSALLCAGAVCLCAQTDIFTRSSAERTCLPESTKAARTARLGSESSDRSMHVNAAPDQNEPTTLLDRLPGLEDDMANYTLADVNGDGTTWTFEQQKYGGETTSSYFQLQYADSHEDWLFIPVEIPAVAGDLAFSMFAATQSKFAKFDIRVCVGNAATPEAMTAELVNRSNYYSTSTSWDYVKTPIEGNVAAPCAGQCWIGIKAASSGTSGYLRMRDISLTFTPPAGPPVGPNGEVFEMIPTEDDFNRCTVIDGNGDGCVITYYGQPDSERFDWPIYYNNKTQEPRATSDADEWLVMPAFSMTDTSKAYTVSIEAATTMTTMVESFQIVLAKTADLEGMRTGKVIMDEPVVTNQNYETYSSKFGISEAGEYHIGIHVTSPLLSGWRIGMRNVKVCVTENSSEIPESPSALTVTPDPEGALKAKVDFVMPSNYINGSAMPADERLEAEIVTPSETRTFSSFPGADVSETLDALEGVNPVSVTVRNANGDGLSSKGVVRCGADIPTNPVVSSSVSDDNMELVLRWEPVTVGVNGGVVPQSTLKYNVYKYLENSDNSGWYPVKQGLTECEYSYRPDSPVQNLHSLMVSAVNDKGESEGDMVSYASAVLGTPHTLPMNETFPNGNMKYPGLLIDYPDESYTALWALDSPENLGISGGPAYALMCLVQEVGATGKGYMELPKFSTEGHSKVRVRFLSYICVATPYTVIKAYSSDGRDNAVVLGTVDASTGEGWCELVYDLPERFLDKKWVTVSVDIDCTGAGQAFVIGEADVYERKAKDLVLAHTDLPSYVRLGDEVEFRAFVENRGYTDVTAPEMKAEILEAGQVIGNIDMSFSPVTLTENAKTEYTGRITFDNADFAGKDLSVALSIDPDDEEKANDVLEVALRVGIGSMPVAGELNARRSEGGKVVIDWPDPYMSGLVENMEAYPHGFYDAEMGVWKNMDFDRAYTYVTERYNIPDAGQPKAFQTVNTALSGMTGMGQPSGDQFLMVFCPEGSVADDWLISPEVEGGSKFSFHMTSLSGQYAESLEVLVSTTDIEIDSFRPVKTITTDRAGWELYEIELPANAKYFALHYMSDDKFGLCIDDIIYCPLAPETEITGWNIYRDGSVIKSAHDDTTFTDTTALDTESYEYNVAATGIHNGVEMLFPLSATVKVSAGNAVEDVSADSWHIVAADGYVAVEGCRGMSVDIMDINGRNVFATEAAPETLRLRLAGGIYVVRVDGKSCKVLVR